MSKHRKILALIFLALIWFTQTVCLAETSQTLEKIRVRVGAVLTPQYFELMSNGDFSGYGYEYLQELKKYADWEYDFRIVSWEEALKQLESGQLDLVGYVFKTPDLESKYAFSSISSGAVGSKLVTLSGNLKYDYAFPNQWSGIRIGVSQGNAITQKLQEFSKKNGFTYQLKEYPTFQDTLDGLRKGEVDACLDNLLVAPGGTLQICQIDYTSFYFATPKQTTGILTRLNSAMSRMMIESPKIESFLKQHLQNRAHSSRIIFSESEQAYLNKSPIVKVAGLAGRWPLEDFDAEQGKLKGYSGEILTYISDKSGLKFQVMPFENAQVTDQALRRGEIDMNSRLRETPNEGEYGGVSEPFLSIPHVFVMNKALRNIGEKEKETVRVAMFESLKSQLSYINASYPKSQILYRSSYAECLDAVADGDADVAVCNLYQAQFAIQTQHQNLVVVGNTGFSLPMRFVFAKNVAPELVAIVNKCITSLSPSEINVMLTDATAKSLERKGLDKKTLLAWLIAVLSCSCLIWALVNKQRLERRSAELTRLKKELEGKLELELALRRETAFRENQKGMYDCILEINVSENCVVDSPNNAKLLHQDEVLPGGNFEEFIALDCKKHIKEDFQKEYVNRLSCEYLLALFRLGVPEDEFEVLARVSEGDEFRWQRVIIRLHSDAPSGHLFGVLYFENIHEDKILELQLVNQALRDPLTNLLNKVASQREIDDYLTDRRSGKSGRHAVIIVDIDNFKMVNDIGGHHYGDKVLASIAGILASSARESDIVGRIGGDEFVIFYKHYGDVEFLKERASAILKTVADTYKDCAVPLSLSMGIALYPEHGNGFEELYEKADAVLYASKNAGKNRFSIYDKTTSLEPGAFVNPRDIDLLLNIAMDGFVKVAFTPDWELLYWNHQYQDLMGLTSEQAENKELRKVDFVHPSDRAIVSEAYARHVPTRLPFTVIYRVISADRRCITVRAKYVYAGFVYKSEHPIYYVLFTDITDTLTSMQVADFLQGEKCLIESLNRTTSGYIRFACDETMTVLNCSEEFRKLASFTDSDMGAGLKQKILDVVHPDDLDYFLETYKTAVITRKPFSLVCRRKGDNSSRRFRFKGAILDEKYNGSPVCQGVLVRLDGEPGRYKCEELSMSESEKSLYMRLSHKEFFEYDLTLDTLFLNLKSPSNFAWPVIIQNFSGYASQVLPGQSVYQESWKLLYETLLAHDDVDEVLELMTNEQTDCKYRVQSLRLYNPRGRTVKIIGSLERYNI